MEMNRPVLVSCKPLKTELNRFRKIHITSDESFTLGRGLHNAIVIPSLVISRSHCKFRKLNGCWVIEDNSACGIEVNGVKVGKGNSKNLLNDDIVRLDALQEFVYKFIWPHNNIALKRIKLETDENSSIIDDVKIKFEESQNIEMQHHEDKIQKQKQLQVANKLLQDQLYAKKNIKVEELERSFGLQIENLKGEQKEVQIQKILLIKERDAQISALKKEMDNKINELMDRIKMHSETETELAIENNSLKTKLLKEREEFLAELDKENTSKHELLDRLQQKIKDQEEQRLKEKQALEKEFQVETEKLRLAKDQEMLALVELNKQRELALLEEHNKITQRLEKEISDMKKESKIAAIQLLHIEENVSAPSPQIKDVEKEIKHQEKENRVSDENQPRAGPSNESSKPLEQIGQMMETELQCSICAEIFICPVMLSCGHTFCQYCINLWKKNKKDCPICRTPIKYESRSIVVDSFIEKILPNLSQEMKKKREESLKIRQEEETLPSPGASAQINRRATAESESESQWEDSEGQFTSSEGDATDVFQDDWSSILDQYYSSASDSDGGSDFNSDSNTDDDVTAGSNSCRRRRQRVPGNPGSYYGGYGRCYRCGAKGHWAPGCPNRL